MRARDGACSLKNENDRRQPADDFAWTVLTIQSASSPCRRKQGRHRSWRNKSVYLPWTYWAALPHLPDIRSVWVISSFQDPLHSSVFSVLRSKIRCAHLYFQFCRNVKNVEKKTCMWARFIFLKNSNWKRTKLGISRAGRLLVLFHSPKLLHIVLKLSAKGQSEVFLGLRTSWRRRADNAKSWLKLSGL